MHDPLVDDSLLHRIYLDATEKRWRLENWSDEELWMYCGIQTKEEITHG